MQKSGLGFGFLLSLLLHIGVVIVLLWFMDIAKPKQKSITKHKITLDLNKFQTLPPKPSAALPNIKPQLHKPIPPVKKPIPKTPKPKPKKVVKKPKPKRELKKEPKIKKVTKSIQKQKKSIVKKSKIEPKKETPRKKITKKETTKPKKVLQSKKITKPQKITKPKKVVKKESTKPKTTPKPKRVSHKSKPIIRPKGKDKRLINNLYGSSYSRMSASQRKFIDENLREIIRISQRTLNYLGYPKEALYMHEQGTNIVEFWLYPNGDISHLRLKRRIGSDSLDRQTIEVIKTAYMYYPKPPVKTKIIIYVGYHLR